MKSPSRWAALGAGLGGGVLAAYAVMAIWHEPYSSLLYGLLIPLALFAAVKTARSGAGEAAWFGGLVVLAAMFRMRHESVTGSWYVDYLAPVNSTAIPEVHSWGGLSGLLRCLSYVSSVPPGAVFTLSVICSSLSVGFLAGALWRRQRRMPSEWPSLAIPIWGILMATDGTLTYLGASDAHHNVALLAFSLCAWWYGEASAKEGAGAGAWAPLVGVFVCSAFVGTIRRELLATPIAIPFLFLIGRSFYREWRQVRAMSAVGFGIVAAWLVMSHRNPLGQIAMFHPRTWAEGAYGLYRQTPLSADLPPLLGSSLIGATFLLFLFFSLRYGKRGLLGFAVVSALLTLPKVLGGFAMAPLGGFEDSQRYNIIMIPLALLLAAAGIAFVVELIRSRQAAFRSPAAWVAAAAYLCVRASVAGTPRFVPVDEVARATTAALLVLLGAYACSWFASLKSVSENAKRRVSAALAGAVLLIAAGSAVGARGDARLLPHQAEYAFLSRNLKNVPQGSTVVAVWLSMLNDQRDADTQLAVPHALLVHARPDLKWAALTPGEPIPAIRPLVYYKGASCSIDADAGVTNGADLDGDRKLFRRVAVLCAQLEGMTFKWETRERLKVKEATIHLIDEQVDLGLGWLDEPAPERAKRI